MVDEDDSRLDMARNQGPEPGTTFQWKTYRAYSPDWQHDHCVACLRTLAEYEGPGHLHEGFTTTAEYSLGEFYEWVCLDCFEAIKDQMGWRSIDKCS